MENMFVTVTNCIAVNDMDLPLLVANCNNPENDDKQDDSNEE